MSCLRTWMPLLLALLVLSSSAGAGVFRFADDPRQFDPFIVVHPPGYDGKSGGVLVVRVCAEIGLERMQPAIDEAISTWNDLAPATGNCQTWEEPSDPDFADAPVSMSSVIMHEMGHCLFGLGHSNWPLGGEEPGEDSSFSNTVNASAITVGADGIRGSADDEVSPLPGGGLFDIHHVIVPFIIPRIRIRVSSNVVWDVVFADGFETGDLAVWDEVAP